MTEGDWRMYAVVGDATGRRRSVQMTPGGGGSEVVLKLRTSPSAGTACIGPLASTDGGSLLSFPFKLTSDTAGATIEYKIGPRSRGNRIADRLQHPGFNHRRLLGLRPLD